ncbi:MAG TPA: YceI family protein [Gemmataceae bacterium]|jgi:polyisoprenoid-binding protein YceI|nr:YceI family protein [Gemmataceae bacterium]
MNRFTIFATVLGIGLFTAATQAQNTHTYEVDKTISRVYIRVDRIGRLGHNHAIEGVLTSGSVAPGRTGKLTFDMTSFVADTPQARKYIGLEGNVTALDARKVTESMRSAEVLDVGHFPTATVDITSFRPADGLAAGNPGRYVVDGQFTLRGVSRPVQVVADFAETKTAGVYSLRGWFKIKMSDFGIKPVTLGAGVIGIEDTLTIYGDFFLRRPTP